MKTFSEKHKRIVRAAWSKTTPKSRILMERDLGIDRRSLDQYACGTARPGWVRALKCAAYLGVPVQQVRPDMYE
jgi:hypothetical protein